MNFYRCGSGGGHLEETVLWTNPSPASNFPSTVINLSDDLNNYDYIAIQFKCHQSVNTPVSTAIMSIDDLKKSKNSGYGMLFFIGNLNSAGTASYARRVFYRDDTSLVIDLAYTLNGQNSSQTITTPLKVIGLKQVGGTVPVPVPSDLEETTLWTNSDTTSAFAQQTVTLSESVENYDYIGVKYYYNPSYNTGDCISMNIASLNDIKKWRYSDSTRHNIGSIAIQDNANTAYSRNVFLVSNTEVRFGTAYQVGSGTVSNTTCMPYKVVGLKKVTADTSETTLWTNSSPTSDFVSQTVALSESVNNFDYICIKYCFNKTNTNIVNKAIYRIEDLKASLESNSTNHNIIELGLQNNINVSYSRIVFYINDTSIKFTTGFKVNVADGSSNNACIPLEIIGMKGVQENLSPVGTNVGTLGQTDAHNIKIDLTKRYILWEALLQDDSYYRAGCYYIDKGVISQISESGTGFYAVATISGDVVTISHVPSATASVRYGLIALD